MRYCGDVRQSGVDVSAATIAVAMDSAEGHVRAMDFPLSGIIMLVLGTAAIMAVAWPLESIVF